MIIFIIINHMTLVTLFSMKSPSRFMITEYCVRSDLKRTHHCLHCCWNWYIRKWVINQIFTLADNKVMTKYSFENLHKLNRFAVRCATPYTFQWAFHVNRNKSLHNGKKIKNLIIYGRPNNSAIPRSCSTVHKEPFSTRKEPGACLVLVVEQMLHQFQPGVSKEPVSFSTMFVSY